MKTLSLFSILFSLVFFNSCSSTSVVSKGLLQKRKYTKGYHWSKSSTLSQSAKKTEIFDLKKLPPIEKFKLVDEKVDDEVFSPNSEDSVKIIMKNDFIYQGLLLKTTESGYYVFVENERKLFLPKDEIKSFEIIIQNTVSETSQLTPQSSNETTKNQRVPQLDSNKVTEEKQRNVFKYKKLHQSSRLSILFLILGILTMPIGIGFILYLISFFLAQHGKNRSREEPDLYNFKKSNTLFWLITVPLILALIALIISLVFLFFFVFVL